MSGASQASPNESPTKLDVVVVTGLSGAGKSTAVKALEDIGYFCVDNLPTPVVIATLEALAEGGERRVALGIDVRVRAYLESAGQILDALSQRTDIELSVLFLDSSEELLARRFSATRRPHPLTTQDAENPRALVEGIRLERDLLAPLRARSGVVIDSTNLTVHDLRRAVIERFGEPAGERRMLIRVVSFGFKYGRPHDADLVFDVRFLPNPYFVDELRAQSGLDDAVAGYVMDSSDTEGFMKRCLDLLLFCIPRYEAEGKSYVTIAVGCTGGRHRSVALTERLAQNLSDTLGGVVDSVHRDLRRVEHTSTIAPPVGVIAPPR